MSTRQPSAPPLSLSWAPFKVLRGKSLWPITKAVFREVINDDCIDLAAQMSFYFALSLLPFLIVIAAFVGMLPSTTLWHSLAEWITNYLPRGARRMVFLAILGLTQSSGTFLSIGLAATLWTSSSGFVSLMESLTVAYGSKDTRSYWRKRLIAFAATVIGAVLLILSFGLLAFGHRIAGFISAELGEPNRLHLPWELGRWVMSIILMVLGLDLMNYSLPDLKRPWHWLTPGTIFVVLTMVAGSAGFNFYLAHFSSYPRFYGAMAGFIILVTWIYLASLIPLVGAEMDSVLEDLRRNRARA